MYHRRDLNAEKKRKRYQELVRDFDRDALYTPTEL